MKAFLKKNWFVLCLPLAVALAFVLPEAGGSGGWLHSEITTKLGVAIIFLTQGLTLPGSALKESALQWKLHSLVQVFSFVVFPLIGLGLDQLIGAHLAPDLRLGFLFLCVLPSTISMSIALTTLAGGNAAGAIFNAVLSNVSGVFLTPLWVAYLMRTSGQSQPLGPIIQQIILLLLVPLVIGQLLRFGVRAWADKKKKALSNLSNGIILYIIFATFCNSVQAQVWSKFGFGVTLVALAGVVFLFFLSTGLVVLLQKLLRLNRGDRIAALFCAPQKSMATGVPLAKLIFGAHPGLGLILLPLMFYHPFQLLLGGVLAGWLSRHDHE